MSLLERYLGPNKLTKSTDWADWYSDIRSIAREEGVLEYFDIYTEEPPYPVLEDLPKLRMHQPGVTSTSNGPEISEEKRRLLREACNAVDERNIPVRRTLCAIRCVGEDLRSRLGSDADEFLKHNAHTSPYQALKLLYGWAISSGAPTSE